METIFRDTNLVAISLIIGGIVMFIAEKFCEKYEYVKKESSAQLKDAKKYMKRLLPVVKKELAKEGLQPWKVEIRAKHNYSLWKKLEKNNPH